MKRIKFESLVVLMLLLFKCLNTNSEPKVIQIEDEKTIEILTSLVPEKYYFSQNFFLAIHNKRNPPGSGSEGTHDSSRAYYLVIGEGEDDPVYSVFEVGPFYAPKIKEIREGKDLIEIDVEYYSNKERATITMLVGLGTVTLRK